MTHGPHDKFHASSPTYRENYQSIWGEKKQKQLKDKKQLSNNGESHYTQAYVSWLESKIGDVKIDKEWK